MQLPQRMGVPRVLVRVFHPILIWAISGGFVGASMTAALLILYAWFSRYGLAIVRIQNDTYLGALVGAHLGLMIAYLRGHQGQAPSIWSRLRHDPVGMILAVLLLIYGIYWGFISF